MKLSEIQPPETERHRQREKDRERESRSKAKQTVSSQAAGMPAA